MRTIQIVVLLALIAGSFLALDAAQTCNSTI
jgi:hypothetical protein